MRITHFACGSLEERFNNEMAKTVFIIYLPHLLETTYVSTSRTEVVMNRLVVDERLPFRPAA